MKQCLDEDGICLEYKFFDEFFPTDKHCSRVPDVFTLWHYNGLSNVGQKVVVMQICRHWFIIAYLTSLD